MKNTKNYECRTLRVEDIGDILGIGRSAAYSLVRQAEISSGNPFSVFRVGSTLLISKKSFDAYLESVGA